MSSIEATEKENTRHLLDKAIVIAAYAHAEQTDKNGEPYILHPLRVMMALNSDEERICGVLHDVIEDTDVTYDQLIDMGFGDAIITTLKALTRKHKESYEDFISRVLCDSVACVVKSADLEDNLLKHRLGLLDSKTADRLQSKYKAAQRRIAVQLAENNCL